MTQDFSLIQVMMKGGWTIGLLVVLSILVFAVLYERWSYFRAHFQGREEVLAGLEPFLNRKSAQECIEACDRNGTILAQIIRAGLKAKTDKAGVNGSMEREAKIQLLKLEKHLPFLATIGSIAPFVGLFGTVLGIIRAFRDLALANAGGAAVVSQGIAEALIATATGLFVAITSVFIYNSFQARLNAIAQEAEIVISEMNERIGS
jgi:biopolymer transport protein ExbB/TolQ